MGVLKLAGVASPKRRLCHPGSHFFVRVKKYHVGLWGKSSHFNLFLKQPCSTVNWNSMRKYFNSEKRPFKKLYIINFQTFITEVLTKPFVIKIVIGRVKIDSCSN